MAFGGETSLGATGSTANNQSQLDLTTVAAINAGEFVVVVVAADNIANGGDDNACSGVTLGVGGQALTKAVQIANALAAQAGASLSIWYGKATSGLASGGIIRATFGSGTLVDASGLTARKWTIGVGNGVALDGTPGTLVNNTGADPGSLDVTSSGAAGLRVRGIASQVGNNTNLTPTASWTAWANGNSATTGTTGEICARAESRIVTAANAASDPTYVSAIYASAHVVFKETIATVMTATPLAVSVDGQTAAFEFAYNLIAAPLDVVVDGQDAAFVVGSGVHTKMIAETTAVAVTTNPAAVHHSMSAASTQIIVDGKTASAKLKMTASVAAVNVAFNQAIFDRKMLATVSQINVTGQVANFEYLIKYLMTAETTLVAVTGQDAALIYRPVLHLKMQAETMAVFVSAREAMLNSRRRVKLSIGQPVPPSYRRM